PGTAAAPCHRPRCLSPRAPRELALVGLEGIVQLAPHGARLAVADGLAVERGDRLHLARGRAQQYFARAVQLRFRYRNRAPLHAGLVGDFLDDAASGARQQLPGIRWRAQLALDDRV